MQEASSGYQEVQKANSECLEVHKAKSGYLEVQEEGCLHRTVKKNDPFQTVPGSIPGSYIPAFTGTLKDILTRGSDANFSTACFYCGLTSCNWSGKAPGIQGNSTVNGS